MRLLILRSLWTNGFDLAAALADCQRGDYDGVEGPLPADSQCAAAFVSRLREARILFIAEITTGGGYVPATRSQAIHRRDFEARLHACLDAEPMFATVLAGCDGWTVDEAVDFFGWAMQLASRLGINVSFETHRSRCLFHPWAAASVLRQLPGLQLTCDFSHWCCVCERLVLDEEEALLRLVARHAAHVHARVGHAQGPQVPHPAAPRYADALAAHERWWGTIWRAKEAARVEAFTFTPEFGPDGYQQVHPDTGLPAFSLDETNRWMANWLRQRFTSLKPQANPTPSHV
jgi:hypothetical protein